MISFVATPIGNLKDITLRALEALRAADAVFCEDTRRTLGLLNAYEIKKPLFSCHKYNEREAAEKMLALSREGKAVCVVSDAGMPVISDPGREVCAVLKAAGASGAVCLRERDAFIPLRPAGCGGVSQRAVRSIRRAPRLRRAGDHQTA